MNTFASRFIAPLSVFALLVAASFAQDLTDTQKSEVIEDLNKALTERAFVPGKSFAGWPDALKAKETEISFATTGATFGQIINKALRDYGMSHLRFMVPQQAARINQTSTVGSGITVVNEAEGQRVRSVIAAAPAGIAGVKVGDLILRINDAVPTNQLAQLEEGKEVVLKIKRGEELLDIKFIVAKYSTVRPEELNWPNPKTAALKVYTFSAGYDRARVEKLLDEAKTAETLIIDLRGNGGGAVNNLNHLLSQVLPDGTVYGSFLSRRTVDQYIAANPGRSQDIVEIARWNPNKAKTAARGRTPFAGKIAVLINRGSGSASEIFAAAMRELREAPLIGAPTAGAVLASTYVRLRHGFAVQIPISDYITVKEYRIEKNPLKPDVEMPGDATTDQWMEAAQLAFQQD